MEEKYDICKFYPDDATEKAKRTFRNIIGLADNMLHDLNKTERLEKHECKVCFYHAMIHGRIGGQAITFKRCVNCQKNMTFNNTNTDKFCLDCAKEHELCKHCGADINLGERGIHFNYLV